MIQPFSPAGMPMADLGFTTANGAIGRSPQNNYATVQGGDVSITRSLSTDPAVVNIPITNYGSGSICWEGITFGITSNTGLGSATYTINGIPISSTTRYCLAPGASMTIVVTYNGNDGAFRGNFTFGNLSSFNTRTPFTVFNFRMAMTSLG